ncbi:hypothetical protein METBIDRAFT_205822 [Metschnikowia bicuspidata var. bicuspidata NRRL YB-4993]|uniref:PX domain-containing protein n=1 Tax=Metschnikowia bicuspidata var. bicuspidata NRRL YB-4993 TaxID=869754 RepID=A0A1A0H9W1_9ASCO|nr:hypothetical protein METBIDRAFT_205822 [Metschnikowia bicuspidata var. bicuspidata NRRL YB-4993]OBA20785.1 hypothetical protein METBIDRAFT_205822 [Metschnikowia bicuspidata var. bicuspidata NRRL YB-4993]
MDDSDIFPDIEQDNNPLFFSPSASAGHARTNTESAVQNDPKYALNLQESYVDFGSTSLVNNSLGLSQKIRKMLQNPRLQIDVILSERLVNTAVVVYLIEIKIEGSQDQEDSVIVKRRYSEFKLLRDNLVKLFPTVIIPPIPEKHTLLTYLINSLDNAKELSVIDVRKRYFKKFLQDVVFHANPLLKSCPLLLKFFDPNYERSWENAINEPPVSLLPQNILLANPNNPTDQNGLYLLLPAIAGFDVTSPDNLSSLHKINGDLHKLHNEVKLFNLKESNSSELQEYEDFFSDIPPELLHFEKNVHQNIKVLSDLHKLNGRNIRNFKLMIDVLIELGGNLNNFSLQVHEMVPQDNNQLSLVIERFGSTMDSNFLNFEHFLHEHVIPEWEEPVNQFAQYYLSALQLVKFYKYKLLQYKLLYKLKFAKIQELLNSTHNEESLKHLKNLNINSPSITSAIQRIESKQKNRKPPSGKKSWYGLFGGNKPTFSLSEEQLNGDRPAPVLDEASAFTQPQMNINIQHRVQHIEKELDKLDQLIGLFNEDMKKLTENLKFNFQEYTMKMEKKWLLVMIDLVRAGRQLFEENLQNWTDLKTYVDQSSDDLSTDRISETLSR